MSETTPLHKMNPLTRFSDRAADYAKYRPSYPAEAIDIILEGLDTSCGLIAADIGAGTGISARLLADRGVRVLAIEPNAAMRETAEPHLLVEFREATAEATHLADASVDLVTCFQAFHWFDPTPTLSEFHRILKPSGRLAVVWNNRDLKDKFTKNYSDLVRRASNHHPAESRLVNVDAPLKSSLFQQVSCYTFAYRQALDLEGLIGRAQSTSYIPREGQVQLQLVSDLTTLYEQFRNEYGLVYLAYYTNVFLTHPGSD